MNSGTNRELCFFLGIIIVIVGKSVVVNILVYLGLVCRGEAIQMSSGGLRTLVYHLKHSQSPHPYTHWRASLLLLWAQLWTLVCQRHQLQEPHENSHGYTLLIDNSLRTSRYVSIEMLAVTLHISLMKPLKRNCHNFKCSFPSLSSGEKPYVCTVPGCEKRFTEYSSLYKHHVVHTPCKPYNCNHCGKTYKQISTLAMHKRTAHNDTEPIEEEQEAYFEPPAGVCLHLCNIETHLKEYVSWQKFLIQELAIRRQCYKTDM